MADKLTLEQVETLSVSMLVNTLKHYPARVSQMLQDRKAKGENWFAEWHFTTGMAIRNELRSHVCFDADLPGESKNWDDYYIEYLEKALDEFEEEIKNDK